MTQTLASLNLALYLPAVLALLLVPGPVVLYIITRTLDQGLRAGLVSVLGLEIGNFFHVIAATLGLSAVLLSSPLAFNVVKYLGAAYLIWLGVQKLREKDVVKDEALSRDPPRKIFLQGIAVAALNPKTALFFLAFLPQFVDPSQDAPRQFFVLGIIFFALAVVSDSLYAFLAGAVGQRLRSSRAYLRFQRLFSAGVYIALGLGAALAGV